jgi:hypothetical protein
MVCHKQDAAAHDIYSKCAQSFETPELVCVRCPTRMHLDCTPGWSVVTIKTDEATGRRNAAGGYAPLSHYRYALKLLLYEPLSYYLQ